MNKYENAGRRFLLVTPFTIPETAGSGINAFQYARYINQQGCSATVLTFNRNLKLKTREHKDDVAIIRIPYFNRSNLHKLLSLPVLAIYYIFYAFRHDVILIYGNRILAYEFLILFSSFLKRKIIFQSLLPGVDDMNTICDTNKVLYHFLFRRIDVYHSINRQFSFYFADHIKRPQRILEIPQGVDIDKYFPVGGEQKRILRQKLNIPSGYVFISVGFPFTYIILGDFYFRNGHFLEHYSPESDELITLGNKLLGNKLQFKGFVSNVDEYLKCADVFIHGAHNEGLPNVILEAMATGLPVITYNIPGLQDFVLFNNHNCLTYNLYDELAPLLRRILKNKAQADAIAMNGRKYIESSGSFGAFFNALSDKISHIQIPETGK
jgi:glycosyltransferase involved in cell wall biosynthesis